MPLTGLIAAPHTPFHDDGSLNLERIDQQCEHLIRTGVNGAFVCGTTGEGLSLTSGERRSVAEHWVKAAGGHLQVIVHVGHAAAAEAMGLAAHAQSLGVTAVAAVAPFYHRAADEAGLVEFLAQIASASPQTPFYFYDIPSVTHVTVKTCDVMRRAAEMIPTFAGVKYSNTDLVMLQECVQLHDRKYDVLFGCDEMLLAAWTFGVRGAVGSTYNFLAPLYQEMFALAYAGKFGKARQLQFAAVRIVRVMEKLGGVAAGKAIMKLIGIDCGPVRTPLKTVDVDVLRSELEKGGLLDIIRG